MKGVRFSLPAPKIFEFGSIHDTDSVNLWYTKHMNTCDAAECSNKIKKSGKRFCSLSCANKTNARRGKKKFYRVCDYIKCGKSFETEDRMKRFCNRSCSASHNNMLHPKRTRGLGKPAYTHPCPGCSEDTTKTNYCSIKCRHRHEIKQYLSGELDGSTTYGVASYAKRYVLDRSDNRCEGYDERIPGRCTETRIVQIDHINGNWEDNRPYNLRALCPTCHALTPNYAGRNRGKGRTWKQNYNQYISLEKLTEMETSGTLVS